MQRRLLLVDDEPAILHALQRELHRQPYEVLTAGSAAEALEKLATTEVQVILSDQRMPGMSGVELLTRVSEQYPQIIRMILSGYTDFSALIDAINKGGIYKFLHKPWESGQIAQVVAMAFTQFDLVQANEVFGRVFDETDEGIVIIETTGLVRAANPAFCAMTGYPAAQINGQHIASLGEHHTGQPGWGASIASAMSDAAGRQSATWRDELWLQRQGGELIPVAASLSTLCAVTGQPNQYVLLCSDITERKQREIALMESEKRFRDFMEFAPIGMAIIGLDGELLKVNKSLCEILGYPREELEQRRFETLAHPDDLSADMASRRQLLTGEIRLWDAERRYLCKSGQMVWVHLTATVLRDINGQPHCFDVQIEDISERRAQQEQIHKLAYYDALTGLPNRRLLVDRLDHVLAQARRNERMAAILFVDLDHFKEVNDIHGHDAGDDLLRMVAQRLQACVRLADTVSRQGGDEFILLLAEIGEAQGAVRVAEKIVASIGQAYELPGRSITLNQISASVGIAVFPGDGLDAETLMKHADSAMYAAKAGGRNGYRLYAQTLEQGAQSD